MVWVKPVYCQGIYPTHTIASDRAAVVQLLTSLVITQFEPRFEPITSTTTSGCTTFYATVAGFSLTNHKQRKALLLIDYNYYYF